MKNLKNLQRQIRTLLGVLIFLGITTSTAMAQVVLTQNFEGNSVNDTYGTMSQSGTPTAVVVLDPLNSGNKVLNHTPGGNFNNAAFVIPFTLPYGRTLSEYTHLKLKVLMRGSDGDVTHKTVRIGAFQNSPTGQFVSSSTQAYHVGSFASGGSQESWKSFEVSITNTFDYTGTVYIAIGAHTGSSASWRFDDFELVGPTEPLGEPDPNVDCLVDESVLEYDFENYDINDNFGTMTQSGTATATIVDDPVSPGNKVLRHTPGGSFSNSAFVIPFTLPAGRALSEYTHVDFRLRMNDGDVGFKTLRIGAFENEPSGTFVSNSHQSYHITASGGFSTGGAQSAWKTLSVPITNTSAFTGTVYLAFGWHTNDSAIWYVDDMTLVGPSGGGGGGCSVEITGTAGWRMLSFPITGGTVADISDDTAIQGITGGEYPSMPSNFLIFKEGGISAPFAKPADMSTPIGDGYGFITYFFNNDVAGSSELPVTLSVTGEEPAGDVDVTLNASGNFTLVGNPFASSIRAGDITVTGGTIQNNIALWNNTGTYLVFDRTDEEEELISIWQGFWVESTDAATSITIPKSAKTSTEATGYFGKNAIASRADIRFRLTSESTIDEAIRLSFREDAVIGWDQADASKFVPLVSRYAILSFVGEERMKSVFSLPSNLKDAIDIDLRLDVVGVSGEFTLDWTGIAQIPTDWTIMLYDFETGEQVSMQATSAYTFTAHSQQKEVAVNPAARVEPNLLFSSEEGTYRFRISIIPGTGTDTGGPGERVTELALGQNWPNPFNPVTQIQYSVPESGQVRLAVYDLLGREVAELVNTTQSAGAYQTSWNAAGVSSGVYIYRLETGGQTLTRRMTLIK